MNYDLAGKPSFLNTRIIALQGEKVNQNSWNAPAFAGAFILILSSRSVPQRIVIRHHRQIVVVRVLVFHIRNVITENGRREREDAPGQKGHKNCKGEFGA